MNAVNKSMSLVEWSLLVALSILWGGTFFAIDVAVDALPPLTVVALRVGLAALALNLTVRMLGLRMPKGRPLWSAFLVMGVLNNAIPYSLIVWGQTYIGGGLASILNASTPLFTAIVAHYQTQDEKLTGGRLVGVVAGMAGVAVMIGPSALNGLGMNGVAQLAVLGAAISYSFAGVFGRRFRGLGVTPLVTAAGQVTASSAVIIPMALLLDRPWLLPMPGWEIWVAVIGLALFSTALAFILYFRILATAGATNLLLVTVLVPVSAILLGVLVLGEQIEPKHLAGMGLIGAGLAAIDGRSIAFLRRLRTAPLSTTRQPVTVPAPGRR